MTDSEADLILKVVNKHVDHAPDLGVAGGGARYVGYYETDLGDQWIFIREIDSGTPAPRATVYGGDLAWQKIEIYERTEDELRAEWQEQRTEWQTRMGKEPPDSPDTAEVYIRKACHPLTGGRVILDSSELAWVIQCWEASFGIDGANERVEAFGRRWARQHWVDALAGHPQSGAFRDASSALHGSLAFEVGRRGWNMLGFQLAEKVMWDELEKIEQERESK